MNHTWTITKLQTEDNHNYTNIVVGIDWILTTTDGTYTASVGKQQPIAFAEGNFIPYDQLSEDEVKQWLFESMGERKQMFENQMEININKKYKPVTVLPWANT